MIWPFSSHKMPKPTCDREAALVALKIAKAQAALQISRSDDIIRTITTDCQEDRQPTNR